MPPTARSAELHSGMPLTENPVRAKLAAIAMAAHDTWDAGRDLQASKRADELANNLAGLAGITVITPGSYGPDRHYRCAHYAFGTAGGERWAQPGNRELSPLWARPLAYLKHAGYEPVDDPLTGDIAAYAPFPLHETSAASLFRHFGVVATDGTIISKFGQGPVVRHDIGQVPSSYGNYAYFLRKTAA